MTEQFYILLLNNTGRVLGIRQISSGSSNGIDNLLKLDYAYEIADMDKKREIIAAVCPDKLKIENGALRTVRINEVIKLIWQKKSDLRENKKGQNENKFTLSSEVGMAGFTKNHSNHLFYRSLPAKKKA